MSGGALSLSKMFKLTVDSGMFMNFLINFVKNRHNSCKLNSIFQIFSQELVNIDFGRGQRN